MNRSILVGILALTLTSCAHVDPSVLSTKAQDWSLSHMQTEGVDIYRGKHMVYSRTQWEKTPDGLNALSVENFHHKSTLVLSIERSEGGEIVQSEAYHGITVYLIRPKNPDIPPAVLVCNLKTDHLLELYEQRKDGFFWPVDADTYHRFRTDESFERSLARKYITLNATRKKFEQDL